MALHSALKYVCLVFSYGTVFYQYSFTTFWRIIVEKHLDLCQCKSPLEMLAVCHFTFGTIRFQLGQESFSYDCLCTNFFKVYLADRKYCVSIMCRS